MNNTCPSCQQPIDAEETQQYAGGSSVTRCSKCGAVISEHHATSTYHRVPEEPTNRIVKFKLIRLLGRGGFGAVWLAEDRNLGRQVALKLPKATGKDAKLLHEAQTAAKLRHPNIVSIYEVGVEEDQVFIASEFVDGEDLRSELALGRPEVGRATHLIASLARAVQHAHDHGVVHRDIKPANVILNATGEPFITDFGIAKHLAIEETISTDGEVVGTISYMSPEQARGSTRETDHRADIYALGVMLFEMLTEYRPFRGNARAVIHQKIYEDAPSPRKLVPSLPRDLETICLKCLEREPAKRYATAADLVDELERFDQGIPIKARPISRGEKVWRWCRRQPAIAALLAAFFVSLVGGLFGVSFFWMRAANNAEKTRHSLYRTHMNLASKLWESGDIAGLRHVLARYETDDAARDLRAFEWYYYKTLTEPFVQTVNHGEVVTDVGVSRDGKLFASAGTDRLVRVWDSKTGSLVRSLRHAVGRIGAIHFSPVDDRLVSANSDGVVRLWNPLQHDHTAGEFSHGNGLSHVRFSPDGGWLLSGGRNGEVRLWRVGSREQVAELTGARSSVEDMRFSHDGRWIAIATQDGTLSVWDAMARKLAHRVDTKSRMLSMTFVNENAIATGSYGSRIQYWSIESGDRLTTVPMRGAVGDLEFVPDTDLLAAVSTTGQLDLFSAEHQRFRSVATHTLTHGLLARSHDGQLLAIGSGDGSVKLLRLASLQRRDSLWHDKHVRDVEFRSNGARIVTAVGDGSVQQWDLETNQRQELVPLTGKEMLALAVRPGDDFLAAAGMTREISLIGDASSERIPVDFSGFSSLAFSPNGELLACGGRNGTVLVYAHGSTDEPRFEISTADGQVNAVAFSADNSRLIVAYSGGRIATVKTSDGAPAAADVNVASTPFALLVCTGGKEIAIGTQTGEIHFLDATTHKALRVLKAHSSRINALAAFPGGHRVVSGGRDRELRIWDVKSGDLVTTLVGHRRQVFAIAVSSDGGTIVSAGLAGDVRLWRSSP